MTDSTVKRLDIYVKERLGISRSEASRLIVEGYVKHGDRILKKPSHLTDGEGISIDEGGLLPYISRGGLKLKKALDDFNISLKDKVCLDIGSSTGGFTHCMLKEGARLVYAVDVGTDQLDPSLKSDSRVISMEKTNILDVTGFDIIPEFVSIDVSFVSLSKIMGKAYELTAEDSEGIFLIKPQFEAGREFLNKKGICRDPKIHKRVISDIISASKSVGYGVKGLDNSPIKGGDGNIEYLLYVTKKDDGILLLPKEIESIIKRAREV